LKGWIYFIGGRAMLMQDVLRLTDRFLDWRNPDAIDRQERLIQCLALVGIVHALLTIGFNQLQELEKRYHRAHALPELHFEFTMLPPPAQPKPAETAPPPTSISEGEMDIGGKQAAAPSSQSAKVPSVNADTRIAEVPHVVTTHRVPLPQEAPTATAPPAVPQPVKPTTTASETAGSPITDGVAAAPTGEGVDGDGKGHGATVGDGKLNADAGGEVISTRTEHAVAKGNIRPYHLAMLKQVAQTWRPIKRVETVTVVLTIAKDGTLLSSEVLDASTKKAAANALKALADIQFAPLPDWFRGEELAFKITLSAEDGVQ
jgi:hypothetical protein